MRLPHVNRGLVWGMLGIVLVVTISGVAFGATQVLDEAEQPTAPIGQAVSTVGTDRTDAIPPAAPRGIQGPANPVNGPAEAGATESPPTDGQAPGRVPAPLQQASPAEACQTGYSAGTSVEQSIDPLALSSDEIRRMVSRYNEAVGEQGLPDFAGDLVEERMLVRVTRGPNHESTVQRYGVRTDGVKRVIEVTKLDAESVSSFDPQVNLDVESAIATGLISADEPSRVAREAVKTGRIDVAGQGVGNTVKYGVAERVGRIQTKYLETESESPYTVQAGERRQTDWKGSTVSIEQDDLGRTVVGPPQNREDPPPGDTTVIDPTTGISIGVTPGSCCRSLMSVHTGELSATAGVYASLAELGCPHECSVDGSHTAKIELVLVQQGWDPDEYEDAQTWINSVGTIGSIAAGDLTGAIYGGEFLDTGFAAGKTRGFSVWAKATCQECDVNTCYGCWNESDLVNDGVRYKKVAEFTEGVTATGDSDDDGQMEFEPVRKPEGYVGADFSWEKFRNQLFSPVAADLRVQCRREEGF